MGVLVGAINTAVLICSSLTMALAVRAGQLGNRKAIIWFLIATMVLGGCSWG
jgi:cytochrome c oxidase subunit III